MPEALRTEILWRAYVPRWAHAPLSGAGAARFGGRWNPVGAQAVYAARELLGERHPHGVHAMHAAVDLDEARAVGREDHLAVRRAVPEGASSLRS